MTYLDIVNKVLVRLREREVSTVDQTTYSSMVGAFVNDSKSAIEKAWNWSSLREILTVATVDGTSEYSLVGFGQEGRLISGWNDTSNGALTGKSQTWFDLQNYSSAVPEGSPNKYTFRGEDSNDDSKIEVHPIPDAVYSLKFNCSIPQADLSADGDALSVPWRPVVLLAVASLAEEKGEAGGTTSARYFEMADKALSDSIAIDEAKHPIENIWHGV